MSAKTQLQKSINRRRANAQEWLDAHPTPFEMDQVKAMAEHKLWVENTAQSIVNSLPSLRAFQLGITDGNAFDASTEITAAVSARFEDKFQASQLAHVAAHAMYIVMSQAT